MTGPGVDRFFAFVKARHDVYLARAAGGPAPWTDDPILREWKFCNVYRELDRVTAWIRDNWREPNADDPDLWFAMTVARFINWPDTLKELGYPVPWRPKLFLEVMRDRAERGDKVYTGAYMIRADSGNPGRSTAAYQEEAMFTPMWTLRVTLRPGPVDTLQSTHILWGGLYGLGSFMAAQVIADVKYAGPLLNASDWHTFAASGPGSRRGLNRVREGHAHAPWTEGEWRLRLAQLQEQTLPMFRAAGMSPPHAQDLQNCLCEFDKYERVRLGEGRPRARFKPYRGAS